MRVFVRIAAFAAASLALGLPTAVWPSCEIPRELTASRPDPQGTKTEISVGVYFVDVKSIDDVDQTFIADFVLFASWKDPRLSEDRLGHSLEACAVAYEDIWHPWIAVVNQANLEERSGTLLRVDSEGTVFYRQRYYGKLTAKVDLRDFPFDDQILPVRILLAGADSHNLIAKILDEGTGRLQEFSIADWAVELAEPLLEEEYLEAQDRGIPRLTFRLHAGRNAGFFIWKVLLPLGLIVFMAWTAFLLDPEDLSLQIRIATSAVLTLIAFQFSLAYLLPRISYLTRMDRFVLGSTLLVFLSLGESILSGRLAKAGKKELARSIDRVSMWAFIFLAPLVAIVALWL